MVWNIAIMSLIIMQQGEIVRRHTYMKTPQHNGVTQCMNKILLEKDRCMLSHSGLSKLFWAKVVNTVCYLVNRSLPTTINYKTPFEVWLGTSTNYTHLKVFGCPAYVHVNNGKLEPGIKKYIFLRYGSRVKGYRLWCIDSKSPSFVISRNVTFNESATLDR